MTYLITNSDYRAMENETEEQIFTPLKKAVGDRCCEYMFMGRHTLQARSLKPQTVVVFAYKHTSSRQTIYLTVTGRFFKCVKSNNVHEGHMEEMPMHEGISFFMDNAVAYHEESKMLENLRKLHGNLGELVNAEKKFFNTVGQTNKLSNND